MVSLAMHKVNADMESSWRIQHDSTHYESRMSSQMSGWYSHTIQTSGMDLADDYGDGI